MKSFLPLLIMILGACGQLGAQTDEELQLQEPLVEGNDARFDEFSVAFSSMLQFEEVTKEIARQHPELAPEAKKIQDEMASSAVGKGMQAIVTEMKRRMGREFIEFQKNSREQVRQWGAAEQVDLETAKLGLANAAAMIKGKLPMETLRSVIAMNPDYQASPLKEFEDGWIGGYSTKMDEAKREVHFLLRYPGSWKPAPAATRAELVSLWNDAGHGKHRMSFQAIHAPDPKYAQMKPVELAGILAAPEAKVIDRGEVQVAGFPGARMVYKMPLPAGEDGAAVRVISYSTHAKNHFVILNLFLGEEGKLTNEELVKKYDPLLAEMASKLEVE